MSYLDWKAGDRVVCVDDRPCHLLDGTPYNLLEIGKIYTASWIGPYQWVDTSGIGICLEGIRRPLTVRGNEAPYNTNRFRPVTKRAADISIFTALLTPSEDDKAEIELLEYELERPFQ